MTETRQTEGSGATEDAICEAVISYLAEHPEAQDTARGIAEWWLPEQGLCRGIPETERALEELVQTGRLKARTAADGQRHYRLNPDAR